MIIIHCNLKILSSRSTSTLASQKKDLALLSIGLKLLASSDPPVLASQSLGFQIRRERVDAAIADELLKPTDREIPGEGATRVASATLLAGAALLSAECKGLDAQRLRWSHPHKENSNWKH
ncbi:hypothetical protein AAY473_024239 [Plecturocebus cupreus]